MASRLAWMWSTRRALGAATAGGLGVATSTSSGECGGLRRPTFSTNTTNTPQSSQFSSQISQNSSISSMNCALLCEVSTAPNPTCGTCKLPDGRLLAYHIEGTGVPVICFHGMGSSRFTWLGEKPLNDSCPGVQIIAIDRPGYGGSTPPPFGYSYSEFAQDVAVLADHLNLPRFCVAGHSSGGPYALACAALLPDRVAACAAIASDAPYCHPDAPKELREADSFALRATPEGDGLYGKNPRELATSMRNSSLENGGPIKAHAWRSGVDGWLCDFTLERIPWSFCLEDIKLGPKMTVWVGGEDLEAIKIGSPFLHKCIAGSKFVVVPGGDHGFKRDPVNLANILNEMKSHF
eukprot:CAMPEP_0206427216 /NCGR_PEP_ID=MMETSP0324_2-20121206/4893_1 /ASSEMBLY_ACC=CAM_ASM_000836 /TAXON_ID=2866 /ORGANISM="Crypthecodinium cohnii, Strain Seligo" /LENGTH=349 /DNA_ID=CAMNT_0053892423 /DNA_START=85 /DNA_END=1134 /DNA_ORIENTATION=-